MRPGNDINPAAHRPSREPPVARPEHSESAIIRVVEQQTAKVSSGVFLTAALVSMTAALSLELTGRLRASRFIGMWPAPLLVMGVYNKLLKLLGPR